MKRKKFKRMKRIVSMLLVMIISFTGCSSNSKKVQTSETETAETAKTTEVSDSDEKVITVMISADLNPELGDPTTSGTDFSLYEMIYEPLVKYGENGEYVPALAESWDVSSDGTEYTFYLRKDVKFSDGTNFNADSVIYSAQKWDAKSFSSPMTGIEKIDDYTIKITFEDNCYPCLTELTYPRPYRIAAESAYDKNGEFTMMIGTGEWMVESYIPEEETVLVPNPYYYGEAPNVDKIIIKKVEDGQSRVMALQSQEADISLASIPEDSMSVIENEANLDILKAEGTMGFFLMFNEKNSILQDVNVRKALNYAVDKESIVNDLLDGQGTPAIGILPQTVPYVTESNSEGYEYNIEKAKQLLSEAGYEDSDGDGFVEKDGEKLSLNLVFQSEEYSSWKSLCEYLQSEYAKIGVEINLDLKESAAYYDSIWTNRDFDMIIYRTYEDSWNPHGFLRSMFSYSDDASGICWSDETLNQYLDEVVKIQDEEERQAKYDEIFKLISDKALTVPLYYPLREYVYNTRLTNLVAAPTSYESLEWNLINIE
ncbi:ABC transporter substrate-binding protein [Lachnotalea glycerini]|nr:ABC transporter substrate-binding protein [Lachnotalea glycerini]